MSCALGLRSGIVTASNAATVAENKPDYVFRVRYVATGEQREGSQKLKSHLQLVGCVQRLFCPLPEQSWSTWHRVAMNHHRGLLLPQRVVVAVSVFVEVGADDYLLCTIVNLARTGRNNGLKHTGGITSLKALVTSLRH